MAHQCSTSLGTKSIDVGSMFLIDLSEEESCDLAPEDGNEIDDFRELQTASAAAATTTTISIATSKNSNLGGDEELIALPLIDNNNTTTDIPIPPSNAHIRRRHSSSSVSHSDHLIPSIEADNLFDSVVEDDDDEFLEQEYNDNHHNHYSTDESDDEPLSAEDNPMKLFESIQALARSLHEDAELFGSLPPKRTLESPIRSLLLT